MKGERDLIANTANVAAAINVAIKKARGERGTNWTGFYLTRTFKDPADPTEKLLVLGPFQGNPACKRILFGRGVCGTAAKAKRTQVHILSLSSLLLL